MEDLAEELLSIIFSRLSVKDLLTCKATCREWNTLISSHRFARQHAEREKYRRPDIIMNVYQKHDPRLYRVSYDSLEDRRPCLKKFSWIGKSYEWGDQTVAGCCNGLVCLCPYSGTKVRVWNPATREIWKVRHAFPSWLRDPLILGFGCDPQSDDYKILMMHESGEGSLYSLRNNSAKPIFHEVYTWENVRCQTNPCGVYLKGRLHWSLLNHDDSLVCFDLKDEAFVRTLLLPEGIMAAPSWLGLGVVEDCIFMYVHLDGHACELWVMKEYGIRSSWTRLHRRDYCEPLDSDYCEPLDLTPVVATLDGKVFLFSGETPCFTIYDPTEDSMPPGVTYSERLPSAKRFFCVPWAFKESVISPRALFSVEDSSHTKKLSRLPDLSRFKGTSAVKILLDGNTDKRIIDCDSLVNGTSVGHRVSWMGKSYDDHVVVGSCNGLVLLLQYGKPECLWLWNPSTREVRKIRDHRLSDRNVTYGFGYDTSSGSYKIVVIHLQDLRPRTAHLWCLKRGTWKNITAPSLAGEITASRPSYKVREVQLNGVLHWSALNADGSIMCFDLHEEIFPKTLLLPETTMMVKEESLEVGVGTIGDCLGICMTGVQVHRGLYEVWMMKEYGVRSSWTLVFRTEHEYMRLTPLAITGDGKILFNDDGDGFREYDPAEGRLSVGFKFLFSNSWIYQETSVSPHTLLEAAP